MFDPAAYAKPDAAEPVVRPTTGYDLVGGLARKSLLVWGEHCIECAAPACYKSCDLYAPRPDGSCRRFAFGVHRNRHFRSSGGFGAEVRFKQWAKLESRGNTRMEPFWLVRAKERVIAWTAPWLDWFGRAAARVTGDARWGYVSHVLLERLIRRVHRRKRGVPPDAFVLEVYNPGKPCRIRLSMSAAREAVQADGRRVPPLERSLALPEGYSRHVIESEAFRHVTEQGKPFDVALTPVGESSLHLVFLCADFVVYSARPSAVPAKPAGPTPQVKCVVWDLDNTLWQGVLLENDAVAPHPAAVRLLRLLDERGIVNTIASKNDHQHAWAKLEQLGLAELFVYPRINWAPKSENVKKIAAQLNIGLDAIAFVDDNPFELEQVRQTVPGVLCLAADCIDALGDDPRFAGGQTAESRQRRRFYQAAMVREEKQAAFGDDYLGFLKSCNLILDISDFVPDDLDRVAELIQRTNQLNFSGRKYARAEAEQMLAAPDAEKYVLKCEDRFGSYGTVGFGLVRRSEGIIFVQEFMLSCRVQAKCVEQAFFQFLTEVDGTAGGRRLLVRFRQTERNTPARQLLDSLGFRPDAEANAMVLPLPCERLKPDVVTVRASGVKAGQSLARGEPEPAAEGQAEKDSQLSPLQEA
jgi:FkbH-like protein